MDDLDSDRLLGGRECHTERYRPRVRRGRFREYFTATKEGLQKLYSARSMGDRSGERTNLKLRTFDSPGSALCLSSGQLAPEEISQESLGL
jgi:hypothetical protein